MRREQIKTGSRLPCKTAYHIVTKRLPLHYIVRQGRPDPLSLTSEYSMISTQFTYSTLSDIEHTNQYRSAPPQPLPSVLSSNISTDQAKWRPGRERSAGRSSTELPPARGSQEEGGGFDPDKKEGGGGGFDQPGVPNPCRVYNIYETHRQTGREVVR